MNELYVMLLFTAAADGGRRLGPASSRPDRLGSRWHNVNPSSSTRRITRGLGVFSGADFDCPKDRDAFIGAPWARGACLMKCSGGSTAAAPRCPNAIAVCERLKECTTIDINVEGSVATLKRETELSGRTSRVKDITVRHLRNIRGGGRSQQRTRGKDGACPEHEVSLPELAGQPACVLNCPQLNCTRAVGQCFATSTCVGVEISFQVAGRDAVARLRYEAAVAPGPVERAQAV